MALSAQHSWIGVLFRSVVSEKINVGKRVSCFTKTNLNAAGISLYLRTQIGAGNVVITTEN